MKIGALIHNQPYMLEPNKDRVETTGGSKIKKRQESLQKVEDLKEKVRILVETPLYINSDFLTNDMF